MKSTTAIQRRDEAVLTTDRLPSVVITLPFAPTMMNKGQLDGSLRSAVEEAEHGLLAAHPRQIALPVISRLRETIRGLNFATHHKSIVVQVGLETARTLYIDLPVQPRVLTGQEFHIRDLTTAADGQPPFLVMLLSSKVSKLFRYDGCKLHLIKDNIFHPVYAYTHALPERVANFSDPSARKEQLLDKFLHHMDEGLSIILESYHLPVFIVGVDKVVGHFNRITHNGRHIALSIKKNCMRATETELLELLHPYMNDWWRIRQQMAIKQVEAAQEACKLDTGIDEVKKAVLHRNNRLLVVEKKFSLSSDTAIDGIIEKVLETGGQVEWVNDGQLADCQGIALIRYY